MPGIPNGVEPVENHDDGFAELCSNLKQTFPERIGREAWYLVIAAILTSSPTPERLANFYTHLTTHDPDFTSDESKTRLSLRLRDVLLKLVTLIGAPQVVCALIPLARAEGIPESKAQTSELSEKWTSINDSLIHARGTTTINSIYGPTLLPSIFASFGSHSADIQFMQLFTVYGLYLSDFSLLTALESEAVVFVTIMCTGLRGPSLWHMRGMGRLLGARGTDESTREMGDVKDCLRAVKMAAMSVVEFCGSEMVRRSGMEIERGWVNVGDVLRELGGWGDDKFPAES